MAEPITHTVHPPRIGPSAHEELERLIQTCHEHGVLRLANDLVASNAEIMKILIQALQGPGALNVLQNVSTLAMALSRIPPSRFYRFVFAARDGVMSLTEADGSGSGKPRPAPGLAGAYRMLRDDSLWSAMHPLLDAMRSAAAALNKPVENPISDFAGKPGRSN